MADVSSRPPEVPPKSNIVQELMNGAQQFVPGVPDKPRANVAKDPKQADKQVQQVLDSARRQELPEYRPFDSDVSQIENPQQRIAEAITRLGSKDSAEQARAFLYFMGPRALEQLEQAAEKSDSKDVRRGAQDLVHQIEVRQFLSGGFKDFVEEYQKTGKLLDQMPAEQVGQFYQKLLGDMDKYVDGDRLHRWQEYLARVSPDSMALYDLNQTDDLRSHLRTDYAKWLLESGGENGKQKALEQLTVALNKGEIRNIYDPKFTALARQAGGLNDTAFRRAFLGAGGDVTDLGGQFASEAVAEQFYRERMAALESTGPAHVANFDEISSSNAKRRAWEALRGRLAYLLVSRGENAEAERVLPESVNPGWADNYRRQREIELGLRPRSDNINPEAKVR
jgi:hypothetical protein